VAVPDTVVLTAGDAGCVCIPGSADYAGTLRGDQLLNAAHAARGIAMKYVL
jgi:hypothetical protein